MDFVTEEKLCRLAHDVWRQVAAEPFGGEPTGASLEPDLRAAMPADGACALVDPQAW